MPIGLFPPFPEIPQQYQEPYSGEWSLVEQALREQYAISCKAGDFSAFESGDPMESIRGLVSTLGALKAPIISQRLNLVMCIMESLNLHRRNALYAPEIRVLKAMKNTHPDLERDAKNAHEATIWVYGAERSAIGLKDRVAEVYERIQAL